MNEAKAIIPLPSSTSNLISSTLIISSLPCALLELIQNSLDAASTSISIQLDLSKVTIRCTDDGHGLHSSQLSALFKKGYTSKNDGIGWCGKRGQALYSLSQLGYLEVQTKHKDERTAYQMIVGDDGLIDVTQMRNSPARSGTTVVVRDLFYKWPVRQRTLESTSSKTSTLSQLRQIVATVALAHPQVAFSFHDTSMTTQNEPRPLLKVSKSTTEGLLGRWKQLFGRAGVESVEPFNLVDTGTDLGSAWNASGFFSLSASHSKANQYVFVNSRPLHGSTVHRLVNTRFAASEFAQHASSLLTTSSPLQQSNILSRKSPKKVAERYPIFVLRLELPDEEVEWALEPERRLVEFADPDRMKSFVQSIVDAHLRSQHLLPSEGATQTHEEAIPPSSITPIHLSRSRYQHHPALPVTTPKRRCTEPSEPPTVFPTREKKISQKPIEWTDNKTKRSFLVDQATGHCWDAGVLLENLGDNATNSENDPTKMRRDSAYNEEGAERGTIVPERKGRKTNLVDRSRLKKRLCFVGEEGEEDEEEEPIPEWLASTLQAWHNPIFPSNQAPLPTLPNPTSTSSHFKGPPQDVFGHAHRFDKSSLSNCRLITQLDDKFLLIRLKATLNISALSSDEDQKDVDTLVVVDQHAASERIRVEQLLESYCGCVSRGEKVATTKLKGGEGSLVLVSREEAKFVKDRLGDFKKWGIVINAIGGIDEEADYAQLRLLEVPKVTSERLITDPKLQQELIRSFIVVLRLSRARKASTSLDGQWQKSVKDMPPLMLDLINSKACRGAIMFNDHLSIEQSLRLLCQLSRTTYPFICAHGRPSLMPLVNLAPGLKSKPREVDWKKWGREQRDRAG